MKRTVKFLDACHNLVVAEINLNDGKFSMSGEYNGSYGQCFDDVKPANEWQQKLIDFWKQYHLNDMHAATPRQKQILVEKPENIDFESRCGYLKEKGLLIDYDLTSYYDLLPKHIKEKTAKLLKEFNDLGFEVKFGYRYGMAWLHYPLPDNFEDELIETLDKIEEIELFKKNNKAMKEQIEKIIRENIRNYADGGNLIIAVRKDNYKYNNGEIMKNSVHHIDGTDEYNELDGTCVIPIYNDYAPSNIEEETINDIIEDIKFAIDKAINVSKKYDGEYLTVIMGHDYELGWDEWGSLQEIVVNDAICVGQIEL